MILCKYYRYKNLLIPNVISFVTFLEKVIQPARRQAP